jgi:hypothetical protein
VAGESPEALLEVDADTGTEFDLLPAVVDLLDHNQDTTQRSARSVTATIVHHAPELIETTEMFEHISALLSCDDDTIRERAANAIIQRIEISQSQSQLESLQDPTPPLPSENQINFEELLDHHDSDVRQATIVMMAANATNHPTEINRYREDLRERARSDTPEIQAQAIAALRRLQSKPARSTSETEADIPLITQYSD